MIFIHGWPELGLVWKAQLAYFGSKGWRCIAPDMRGYGGSSVPTLTAAYSVRELVADMVELLDALGGQPAIWIGHDWGSAVAWSMASHHPERCRGVANMCIPYFARGLALPNLIPLVDRGLYPRDKYPVGQWDYWLFYQEHFQRASEDFEADVEATLKLLYRSAPSAPPTGPSFSASIRESGGWFGPARRAPSLARDERMLEQVDFDALVIAFRSTGFKGANAWYLNEAANLAFAAEAANFGRLTLPVLFLHATRDGVCDTFRGRLAEPMREDCQALTEVAIDAGHELMLERPQPVNEALFSWLKTLSH
jgi:pimeloyl-ACP methyl ester carboxylesterase